VYDYQQNLFARSNAKQIYRWSVTKRWRIVKVRAR
jgi:hypothetical protein